MNRDPQPQAAATVILLRSGQGGEIEVLLTRRPEEMAFLGGMYCFPGGTVRSEDFAEGMLLRCHGLTPSDARRRAGAHLSPQRALGLWVAGVREVFEEVGILLAATASGEPVVMDADLERRLAEKHAALLARATSFSELLAAEELLCDVSRLVYFSSWQTPSQFKIRFDTRFYLARLPSDQTPLSLSPEVAHSLWLCPDRALQLFNQGKLPMIFPTFASLRALADFGSVEAVMAEFAAAEDRDDRQPAAIRHGAG